MNGQEAISTEHKGVHIDGKIIFRTGSDIDIKILQPYQNLTTGSHIPYFARPYGSFLGEYGDRSAKEMLTELYELGLYLDKNFESLVKLVKQKRAGWLTGPGIEAFKDFFDTEFPETVSYNLQPQILNILDGKRPLHAEVYSCSSCGKEFLLSV